MPIGAEPSCQHLRLLSINLPSTYEFLPLPNSEMQASGVMPAQTTASLTAQASASLMALFPLSRVGVFELTSYKHRELKHGYLRACMA